jgi:hypothetical protein
MTIRRARTGERTSFGMEVVAVAVGVGFGVADAITRRLHRETVRTPTVPTISLEAGRDARRTASAPRWDRIPASAAHA